MLEEIWTNHGYVQAQNLTANDSLFNVFSGHYEKVRSVVVEYGSYTMYDFYIKTNKDYIPWWNLMGDRVP